MNSSTKPPGQHQSSHKFQFDVDFEMEEERTRVESLRQHENALKNEDIVPQTPAQVFSEEQVYQLSEEALHKGIRQGRMESLQEIEQSIAVFSSNMVDKLSELIQAELSREKLVQEIAVKTTFAAIKKIWPQILNRLGVELVESTIRQSMETNSEETRLVVRVQDTMLDAVVKYLPQLQEQQAFAGKVIVIADQGIMAGDCKIEWADGGLDRISRNLSKQLDAAMERILSNLSSQNADPERMSS